MIKGSFTLKKKPRWHILLGSPGNLHCWRFAVAFSRSPGRDYITSLHERDDLVQEAEQLNTIYQSILVWNLAKRLLTFYFNSLSFIFLAFQNSITHDIKVIRKFRDTMLFCERGIFSPHTLTLLGTKLTPYIGITL